MKTKFIALLVVAVMGIASFAFADCEPNHDENHEKNPCKECKK